MNRPHEQSARSATASEVLLLVRVLLLVICTLLSRNAAANPQPGLAPPEGIDRSTPQRTLNLFFNATRAGDFARAAYALDLRAYAPANQPTAGPKLARQLRYVLDRELWIDLGSVSDEEPGDRSDGPLTDQVGLLSLHDNQVPVRLARVAVADGSAVWVISRETVRAIPQLYDEHGPGLIGDHLPDWAHRQSFAFLSVWQWIGLFGMVFVALLMAFGVTAVSLRLAARLATRTSTKWDDLVVKGLRGPLRAFLTIILTAALTTGLKLPLQIEPIFHKLLGCLLIASTVWMAMRIVSAVSEAIVLQLLNSRADLVVVQGTRTRVAVARRVVNIAILIVGAALALTQFDVVRRVGVSVLASAGVAGVVFGLAAQKVLGNLLAGIQLSIAQPLKIGDRVLIENQFGFVEELGLTFAVIKIWDDRRLVLPITQLVEQSFENWTRTSSQLTGSVVLYADYRVPVARLRDEFLRLVKQDPDWDGITADLLVIETTEHSVVLRGTASAHASVAWELRCRLREQLVAYLQQLDGGRYLPLTRIQMPERTQNLSVERQD